MRLSLIPHPLSPPRGLTLDVEIRRSAKGVSLEYDLAGAVETVLLPPFADRVHTDGLWKATCFEMFIAGAPGYFEYNFSPSGAWAAYGFDGYRSSMRKLDPVAPFIVTRSAFGRFSLTVDVEHPAAAAGPIGLCAVIQFLDGSIDYWALTHPSDKPDFHHPESFALALP